MNVYFSLPSPALIWNKRNPKYWILADDFYIQMFGFEIRIESGFESDLATVPRLFTNIFSANGLWTPAALVHDFLYKHNLQGMCRETADLIFLILMLAYSVPIPVAFLFYSCVRLFGGKYFEKQYRKS
jgi:hypothetical protein